MKKFIKDWMLILAMLAGVSIYLFYLSVPALHAYSAQFLWICKHIQPVLLFLMLFLSFCKIAPSQMKVRKWMLPLLLIQGLSFILGAAFILLGSSARGGAAGGALAGASSLLAPGGTLRIMIEAFMLCMICPTATAAAVVTGKLGGNMAGVVTYTVLINIIVALVVPLVVPLLYPAAEVSAVDASTVDFSATVASTVDCSVTVASVEGSFWSGFIASFWKILSRVFPLLLMPALSAWLVRLVMPRFHKWLLSRANWSFYIWAVSLTLAILMSTRAIVHSGVGFGILALIAVVSLIACLLQFGLGKFIGKTSSTSLKSRRAKAAGSDAGAGVDSAEVQGVDCNDLVHEQTITAGQSLGQKNTVFGIWLAYTFMEPVICVAEGFYSIWHNVFNTIQLRRVK